MPHPPFATNRPAASPALPTAARIGAFSGFETALDPKFAPSPAAVRSITTTCAARLRRPPSRCRSSFTNTRRQCSPRSTSAVPASASWPAMPADPYRPSATGSAAAAASPIALGPLEGIEILCHDRRASPERRTDKQANASLLGTTRRAALEASGDVGRSWVRY